MIAAIPIGWQEQAPTIRDPVPGQAPPEPGPREARQRNFDRRWGLRALIGRPGDAIRHLTAAESGTQIRAPGHRIFSNHPDQGAPRPSTHEAKIKPGAPMIQTSPCPAPAAACLVPPSFSMGG